MGYKTRLFFKWGVFNGWISYVLGELLFSILSDKYVIAPDGSAIGAKPNKNPESGEVVEQAKFFRFIYCGIVTGLFLCCFLFSDIFSRRVYFFLLLRLVLWLKGLLLSNYLWCWYFISSFDFIRFDANKNRNSEDFSYLYYLPSFIIFFFKAFEQVCSSLTFYCIKSKPIGILCLMGNASSMVQIFNGICIVLLAVPFSILWIN